MCRARGQPRLLTRRTQRPGAASRGRQAAGAQGPVLHSRTAACPWRGIHVANVVKCPRLPNLWATLRLGGAGGASPKPQPPRSRPLRPCAHRAGVPIAWSTVPAVPRAPKGRAWGVAAPGLDTKVGVTGREGPVPTPPGHPSLTPKGQGSASAQPPPRRPGASQSPQPQFPRLYRGGMLTPQGHGGRTQSRAVKGPAELDPPLLERCCLSSQVPSGAGPHPRLPLAPGVTGGVGGL